MIHNVMEVKPVFEGQAAAAEAIDFIRRLVRIDTTNPPGNELPAVLAIKEILEQNGFPGTDIQVLESAPGRANLVARLRGDGSKPPFLISGHVDVVPVEREHWSHDPFGAEIDQGCIWGRGTMDMKGFVGMYLETFLQAFRQQCAQGGLKRDLIFAAIADEEAGFTHGSKFLVKEHRPLIEAEYGITEGGAMTVYLGKLRAYPIQVAEKGVAWLRMTTAGEPGHGSMPHTNNSVLHLARAIERLRRAGHGPVHLTPTFLQMIGAIGKQAGFPLSLVLGLLRNPVTAGWLVGALPPETRRMFMPMIINTVTPTVLKAGGKTNVIPSIAEAHLDCRVLPGQTVEDVQREILSITGEGVKLEPILTSPGTEFPTDSELYRLMESATRAMDPEGIVMPFLMMGATDASAYQYAGIKMYGFTPGRLPPDISLVKMAHGHDERMPLQYIETGLPVLWKVVNEISR